MLETEKTDTAQIHEKEPEQLRKQWLEQQQQWKQAQKTRKQARQRQKEAAENRIKRWNRISN